MPDRAQAIDAASASRYRHHPVRPSETIKSPLADRRESSSTAPRAVAALRPIDRLALRFTRRRLIAAVLILGVTWRLVRFALGFPFWGDEAFVGVNFLVRDFAGMFHPLKWGQIVPLGSMWINLAAARLFGVNEWSLRLVQTLAGVAALLLFARFAPRVVPGRAALLATGIFAATYFLVRHGAEIKPYATDLLVSLVLTTLAYSVLSRPASSLRWTALIVFAGVSIWCSYPAVFVAGAVGMTLVWPGLRPRDAAARRVFFSGAACFGLVLISSFAVMYSTYARPHAEQAARIVDTGMWAPTFPPLGEPWKLPLWLAAMHTGRMFAYPVGGEAPYSAGSLALAIIGAGLLARRNGALLLLLLGPLPLALIAAALQKYPYGGSVRTTIYMAPAICLLMGLGGWWLLARVSGLVGGATLLARHALNAGVIALCLGMAVGAVADILKPYQSRVERDGRAAIVDLARQTAPADRWIVFNATEPVAYAPWLGDWKGTGGQFVFDVARLAPVPLAWAPAPEDLDPESGGSVWLLAYRGVRIEFPQAQFDAYRAALEDRLGPAASIRQVVLKQRDGRTEGIDIFRFAPRP